MSNKNLKPITLDQLRQKRDAYLALRTSLIDQTNAVTGKVDVLNELIAETEAKDSAPNVRREEPAGVKGNAKP